MTTARFADGRAAGKRALVTGAARGIGRATAELLACEGAQVALSDIDEPVVRQSAEEIAATVPGTKVLSLGHDVTDPDAWRSVLDRATDAMGGLDILINNAGAAHLRSIEEEDLKGWQWVQRVNAESVFLGCHLALPYLKASPPAAIVNVSSSAAYVARANLAAYNAAKSAVFMLTKSIAVHCARAGYDVRCNSVHPGYIRTRILDPIYERAGDEGAAEAAILREIPLRQLGTPEQVAEAILFMASDASAYITGAELKVDGGTTAV